MISVPAFVLILAAFIFGVVVAIAVLKKETPLTAVSTLEAGVVTEVKSIDANVVTALMAAEKDGKAVAGTVQSYIDGFITKVKAAV
jgi:hypothetical protein